MLQPNLIIIFVYLSGTQLIYAYFAMYMFTKCSDIAFKPVEIIR